MAQPVVVALVCSILVFIHFGTELCKLSLHCNLNMLLQTCKASKEYKETNSINSAQYKRVLNPFLQQTVH